MAQRVSGYVRQANDAYETTSWVTEALVPHIRKLALHVWEPAAGSGMMVEALRNAGFRVTATDINAGADFLKCGVLPNDAIQAICTNPPFSDAQAFIEHALTLNPACRWCGRDAAAHRLRSRENQAPFIADCGAFAKKIVLAKRIVFFDRPTAAPSFNHAWWIWDHQHRGEPTIGYAP
jgi:hypothetical protein